MNEDSEGLRPREFALLVLASGNSSPRRRARDQQADRTGLALKRRVLEELVALDPEPDHLEECLLTIVERLGAPYGPPRSVAMVVLDEWKMASLSPQWVAHLLDTAIKPSPSEESRRGQQLPG